MHPTLSILIFALCIFLSSAQAQRRASKPKEPFSRSVKKTERSLLETPFGRKPSDSRKGRGSLPDFYAKAVKLARDHNQLPSFFSTPLKREKQRSQSPDHFSRGTGKQNRYTLSDHFSRPSSNIGRGTQPDHFSTTAKSREHTESDLHSKGSSRRVYRKNFVGERFRLFNKDPNKKKKHNKRDPFSRDRRKMDRPQMPKGEGDLFPGGVLPRMDDPR